MDLRSFLFKNALSSEVFAQKIGISVGAVNHYINGRRIPAAKVMRKIAEVTRGAVTPNDFYFSTAAERCPPPSAEEGDSHV
nr:MAG TPA: Helix-turn-helix XRE-family like protein [Caudoviricetes sp.]